MSTQEPVTRVVAAVVSEASKEKRGDKELWGLKLKVPFSDYPIPTSMPISWASEVFKGESYMVKLLRGRLVKDDSDGSRDFHYFWDVDEWNTMAPATPAPAASNGDDKFRTRYEVRWTEAMHIAARLLGSFSSLGKGERQKVVDCAEWMYETLAHPPIVEEQPELSETEPAGAGKQSQPKAPANGTQSKTCTKHGTPFDQRGRHPIHEAGGTLIGWCYREGGVEELFGEESK